MAVKLKLLPNFRLLNFPVAMKPNPPLKPTRVLPVFSRVFPLKLKYQSFRFPVSQQQQSRALFATRAAFSARERTGSAGGVSKSLIDDEADLSDWVGGLGSKSLRKTQVFSDSDPENGGGGGRNGGFSRDRNGDRGEKRGRGGDFDEFNSKIRRNGDGYNSGDSSPRRTGRFDGERGRDNERTFSRGRDRMSGDNEFGRKNGLDSNDRFSRGSRDSNDRFIKGSRDSNDRFSKGTRDSNDRFSRGSKDSSFSRGSRDSNDKFRGSRDSNDRFSKGTRDSKDMFSRGSKDSSFSRGSRDSNDRFSRGSRDSNDRFSKGIRDSNDRFSRGSKNSSFSRGSRDSNDKFSRDSNDRFSRGPSNGQENERGRGPKRGSEIEFKSRGSQSQMENGLSGRVEGMRKKIALLSDEDDDVLEEEEGEGKGYARFKELIDSEEGSEEAESDDEDEAEIDNDVEDEAESDDENDALNIETGFAQVKSKDTSPSSSPRGSDSYLSETRFDQCSISPLTLKAIKDVGYEKMTLVQEATLPQILKGKDVLAKARTGTGKTVAFLLPSVELVVKLPPIDRDQKRPPILVLVICPTRELASQAATEANTLLKYHHSIGVQVVIGGTRLPLEQKRLQANPCQILVATPGRLKDHIENTAGFATRLMGVKVLVLDEADHLLDMGFRRDIERIIAAVPKQRQTLLFSATIPEEVRQICHIALKRDHEFINTVEEGSEDTHAQVRQTHLVAPLDNHFTLLYTLLKEHIADDVNYKVLVFCTTAMVTKLVAGLLGELNLNVREIHSRKPQSYRTRVSDEFRKSKGLILVTSDVSARGVDYPDVTLVIQIGLPSDKQQYIHRLGRTGRKGKEGQGILLLAPWEEFFLSTVKDLPISKAEALIVDPDTKKKVERALSHVEMKTKESAYQAWLGYYNSNKTVGKDKYRLVELANEFSRTMGLDNPPAIPKMVLGKMGLKNIPGLRSK